MAAVSWAAHSSVSNAGIESQASSSGAKAIVSNGASQPDPKVNWPRPLTNIAVGHSARPARRLIARCFDYNARLARPVFERAVTAQALRLSSPSPVDRESLLTRTVADVGEACLALESEEQPQEPGSDLAEAPQGKIG